MEIYLDFMLFSVLNLKEITWEYDFDGVKFCNYFSIAVVSLGAILPLVIFIRLILNCRNNLSKTKFKKTMGSVIEDKDIKNREKYSAIAFLTILFFLNRMQLVIVLCYF